MKTIEREHKQAPAYLQLFQKLVGDMKTEVYKPGDRLPSEAEFCHQTGLAKGTVRKAFDKLEAEGYIKRLHGSGTYMLAWQPSLRGLVQFGELCRTQGMSRQECLALLQRVCDRHFLKDTPEGIGVVDCTPEIAADMATALRMGGKFETACYDRDEVIQGVVKPGEQVWVTTKSHYEEVYPTAVSQGKELLLVKATPVPSHSLKRDDHCLLGIVYDSQAFLMHVSHNLALSNIHNTLYLCQKEEWNDKKKAIRQEDIIWLISPTEQDIIRQMEQMGSRYQIYRYEVEPESLEQIKDFMERKRR